MTLSNFSNRPILLIILLTILLAPIFSVLSVSSQENTPETPPGKIELENLHQSVLKTIEIEKTSLEESKQSLEDLQTSEKEFEKRLQSLAIQNSAHSNLLLLPDAQIKDLEEARLANRSAFDKISQMKKLLDEEFRLADLATMRTKEQLVLNERQLADLEGRKSGTEGVRSVIESMETLAGLLSKKLKISERMQGVYEKRIEELASVLTETISLAEKIENYLAARKKQELFKRKTEPFFGLGFKKMLNEVSRLAGQLSAFYNENVWKTELSVVWNSNHYYIFSFVVLFVIFLFLFYRLGRVFDGFLQKPGMESSPWGALALMLFRRSLLYVGIVGYLHAYSQILAIDYEHSIYQLIFNILIVLLFTKWPIDLLRLWNQDCRPNIPFSVHLKLRLLIVLVRYFAIFYLIVDWLLPGTSVILIAGRFAFEIALLVWTGRFWRFLRTHAADFFAQQYKGIEVLKGVTSAILYTVAGVGFIMDLAGFGKLAVYWYASCGKTAVVLMWSALFFLSIRESLDNNLRVTAPIKSLTKEPVFPVRWLMLHVSLIALALLTIFFAMLAWGAKQGLLVNIFNVLTYSIELGQLNTSLINILYAFLTIVLTLLAVRVWRHFLRTKLLARSGLEPGLKDSVTSISAYVAWSIGILIALYAFGLSAASMAVAFGAVGIGLGFGLQNIFNNFVSGIILLFERPIQVGDAIEVNGVWGEVRKINVRSTVVQSYDNASLIIPNSEFISSQVTNWSFKDLRLRRTIKVRVAYASDVELVRKTLYEIASKTQRVLKYPEPFVMFADFGDSSLEFWLRVWTDIDNMLIVESEIRFEIIRLFKERNIEIAFPQQDLHIRSVDEKAIFNLKAGEEK